jgi:hypothetical protein
MQDYEGAGKGCAEKFGKSRDSAAVDARLSSQCLLAEGADVMPRRSVLLIPRIAVHD